MEKSIRIKQVDQDILNKNKELVGSTIYANYFIEEASELTKELLKDMRGIGDIEHIAEEIADVYYTLSMLLSHYGISEEEINKGIRFKEERARARMGIQG